MREYVYGSQSYGVFGVFWIYDWDHLRGDGPPNLSPCHRPNRQFDFALRRRVRAFAEVLCGSGVQFIAMVWYALSYIPFGR